MPQQTVEARVWIVTLSILIRAENKPGAEQGNCDRSHRIRDAAEAALADIILLGIEEHVRPAGKAASDMAAARPISRRTPPFGS